MASHDVDNSTLGIGEARNTVSDDGTIRFFRRAFQRAGAPGDSNSLTKTASRTITVKDPIRVIALAAYDTLNSSTAEAALALGNYQPAAHRTAHSPPMSRTAGLRGMASAYSRSDNDDGSGNFCTDATASGRLLSGKRAHGGRSAIAVESAWACGCHSLRRNHHRRNGDRYGRFREIWPSPRLGAGLLESPRCKPNRRLGRQARILQIHPNAPLTSA